MALLAQVLVAFGALVGRGPHYIIEGDRHGCNLYVVLVGATAKGRKGTSLGRVRSIFEQVDPDFNRERIHHGLSSGEGLVYLVHDAIEEQQPIREKGRVVDYQTVTTDPGIADKRVLIIESEYALVLRVIGRDGNTLSARIREAWDDGQLRIATRTNPLRATDAYVSIIGHITRDEVRRYLDRTELGNGFANRHLWLGGRAFSLMGASRTAICSGFRNVCSRPRSMPARSGACIGRRTGAPSGAKYTRHSPRDALVCSVRSHPAQKRRPYACPCCTRCSITRSRSGPSIFGRRRRSGHMRTPRCGTCSVTRSAIRLRMRSCERCGRRVTGSPGRRYPARSGEIARRARSIARSRCSPSWPRRGARPSGQVDDRRSDGER